ncbi:MAG: DUF1232 domain-containing protein [Myxococcota bacterium]|nr:DUF1232 domain-containing protein [Myxococcota bacterium]
MNETDNRCLETFPAWLTSLPDDIGIAREAIEAAQATPGARQALIAGITYVFKSQDLIPDGVDDIGFIDDACVLRLSAFQALEDDVSDFKEAEAGKKLQRLADDSELIAAFLGESVYDRLMRYTQGLSKGVVRGRTAADIEQTPALYEAFCSEISDFLNQYKSPEFSKDEKNLIKLRAFFEAKLPE